jgi:hypothetical protein
MTDITLMTQTSQTRSAETLLAGTEPYDVSTRRSRLRALLDPASTIPTYVGLAVALAGFVLMAIGWAKVAGLVDVWRQMPYLLSAGLPGLGLVMTGLVIVNVSARRQDAAARARQTAMLAEALRDLQRALDR